MKKLKQLLNCLIPVFFILALLFGSSGCKKNQDIVEEDWFDLIPNGSLFVFQLVTVDLKELFKNEN